MLSLHTYWRSTTSYRVRIALAMKGLDYMSEPVDLLAGAQHEDSYAAVNPIRGVPSLVLEDGTVLTQSMAIIDYLDARVPEPALKSRDIFVRAKVLAAAMVFATDVHPVNNLKVVNRVKELAGSDAALPWMRLWMGEGFRAFDKLIEKETPFAFGDTPTVADICLVAQIYNAHRWEVDLSQTPRLLEIERNCLALPAFESAHPENQMDAT